MAGGPLTDAMRTTLALFDESGEPQTTTEIAERLDLGRRATYGRLDRLVDRGRLRTKKVGANARVWWRPAEPSDRPSAEWPAAAESLVGDVLDDVEVGIFVLDERFDVAWINDTAERYFGVDRERALGRDKRRLVDERIAPAVEDSASFASTVLATYDDNTYTERFECRVTAGDDRSERWLEHRSKPIEAGAYEGGRVELYYDVTDRERAERARLEDRREFASLVEAVEEYAIFTLDTDGRVASWNPGAERIKGYDADEIVGENASAFYTDADREAGLPEANLAAAAEFGSTEDEGWRVRADGSQFWAHVTVTAITDDEGELTGYAKVTHDVTERRERERRLREEKAFTESILENQRDVVYAFDTDGTFRRWNDRLREVTGYADEEIGAMPPADLVSDEAEGDLAAARNRVLEMGENVTVELPLVTKGGETIPYEFTGAPMRDDDGTVRGVTGIGRDVSDRRARERRLERQHEELASELDEVFERVDDAFYALDEQFRYTYVNDRAEELLGRDRADLLGRSVWDAFDLSEDYPVREHYERAMATQESTTFERYSEPLGIWTAMRVYPSESGLSVYFRDVTERKETEAALRESEERHRLALEAGGLGAWELDLESGESPDRSPHHDRIFGYDEPLDEWGIEQFLDHVHPADRERIEESFEAALDEGEWTFECRIVRADGAERWIEARGEISYEGGEPVRALGVVSDVTERKERERKLEESRNRYQTLVEQFPNGVVALVDEDLQYVTIGGTPPEQTGLSPGDIEGSTVREALPDPFADALAPRYEAALEGEPSEFEGEFGDRSFEFRVVPVRDEDGEVFAAMGMSQDVTSRTAYEDYLEDAKSQLEAATEAGAVGTWEWHLREDRFVAGTALARQFGVVPSDARDGVDPERFFDAVHEADRDRVEGEVRAALDECGEFESEFRVRNAEGDVRWVVARGSVECDEAGDPVSFPGALTDITERKRTEIAVERQRQQLAAMNNLNEVVREITEAVVEQSTREEIERTVCDRLARSDSYLFAWIGDVDASSQTVALRTEAGVEGYLDGVTISVDPDDERSEGPTGRALRTGEIQVTTDIRADDRHDPWRPHVEEHGIRSSAAIPIVHEGTVYGVLNVYADRPRAFDGQEREVVAQLGEVVGHAIAAAERKRALMSDELVELEFRIRDVFDVLDVQSGADGRFSLDHSVPAGDGAFLVYGTATADAVDSVHALVEALPHWEAVTFHSDGDPAAFELKLTEPPVLSVVASQGGYVDNAVVEDGDYVMRVHLAPTADVRQVIDSVESAYPTARMLRRRQIRRDHDDPSRTRKHLVADLTDRQRTALEAAYHAGFFEWPRDTSGEDLAESLDVAPPTFHQHLRKAERKVFASLFASAVQAVG
ncbi:PAS domain S-box protein [Halosimplex amylolyticum]|uniref:PAS domain S-box protein n=1 Tax=Halosimplex amylolyticum TaxID=3396616 RepID=UPI003F54CADD